MKMKYLSIIALAAFAMVSCSDEEVLSTKQDKGIPMSFSVSIDNPSSTRADYNPTENGGIKVTWKEGDQVSVISFNEKHGTALTNDIFTATGSGSSAVFSGTYTGANNAPLVRVVYPALTTTGTDGDVTGWATPYVPNTAPRYNFIVSNSNIYQTADLHYINQFADNDASHLQYYDYMSANVDNIANISDVKLKKNTIVAKAVINTQNIPTGFTIERVKITFGENNEIIGRGWGYAYEAYYGRGGYSNYQNLFFGTSATAGNATGIVKTADDNELIAYIPIPPLTQESLTVEAGKTITIALIGNDGVKTELTYSKSKTLTSTLTIPVGTCYTFKATVIAE